MIPVETAIEVLADDCGVSVADLRSRGRSKGIVNARHEIMLVLVRVYSLTFANVGRLLGGRDHSTVSRALSLLERQMLSDVDLRSRIQRMENLAREGETPREARDLEKAVETLLRCLPDDPERSGLVDTPARAADAWREWTSGYDDDPGRIMTTFPNDGYDQMVTVRDIPFYSTCEHHLAPFFGTADVSYIPNEEVIVGLSKINRVVDSFSRRLQTQERITRQIAGCLEDTLAPLGVGVVLRARHLCMESRGVRQHGHSTTTTALLGQYREPEVRAEFLG